MKREEILAHWAPPESPWSLWARPILFAQMTDQDCEHYSKKTWRGIDVSWAPTGAEKIVLILDLPGAESVSTGLALSERGYRPVPLFNACTGPREVVNQKEIIALLPEGAEHLASLDLKEAPPAFLLDSLRMQPESVKSKDFDNRWKVFPQDFPSATFLIERGLTRAVLIQKNSKVPAEDLSHVLRRWQDAGISILAKDLADASPAEPITVARPEEYRSVWQRLRGMLGLSRNPQGGYGGVVPEPSHG